MAGLSVENVGVGVFKRGNEKSYGIEILSLGWAYLDFPEKILSNETEYVEALFKLICVVYP